MLSLPTGWSSCVVNPRFQGPIIHVSLLRRFPPSQDTRQIVRHKVLMPNGRWCSFFRGWDIILLSLAKLFNYTYTTNHTPCFHNTFIRNQEPVHQVHRHAVLPFFCYNWPTSFFIPQFTESFFPVIFPETISFCFSSRVQHWVAILRPLLQWLTGGCWTTRSCGAASSAEGPASGC